MQGTSPGKSPGKLPGKSPGNAKRQVYSSYINPYPEATFDYLIDCRMELEDTKSKSQYGLKGGREPQGGILSGMVSYKAPNTALIPLFQHLLTR